jgi:DMSO/TMAO reductase YedYZ molybdopterin-dependent catalytic subunit
MSDLKTFDRVPDIDQASWRLSISGHVTTPLDLSIDDLRSLPLEAVTDDFECVDDWVAPDLTWRGVRFRTLLDRVDPTSDSRHALVTAADGDYACSFPLDWLGEALLAVDLDGEPLPSAHGGPARLVPIGDAADCWESVKWVASIEVFDTEPVDDDTVEGLAESRIELS